MADADHIPQLAHRCRPELIGAQRAAHPPAWSAEAAADSSRYAVGWTAAQRAGRDQLTWHADRGASMTSKPVAQLLIDLGVTRSHPRPRTSNDCDDPVAAALAV